MNGQMYSSPPFPGHGKGAQQSALNAHASHRPYGTAPTAVRAISLTFARVLSSSTPTSPVSPVRVLPRPYTAGRTDSAPANGLPPSGAGAVHEVSGHLVPAAVAAL